VQALAASVSDTDPLTVLVASDGSIDSLRRILDAVDREGIEVDELTVHTPDLDDVFLSLTGHTTNIAAAAATA
jgi:ABC-2 type transport system ATP-binding protein